MKIYEIDMGNSAEFNKQLADAKKKEQELRVLANKAKQMYQKAMQNYEEVEEKNAEKFDSEPTNSFNGWFTHMFKADPQKAIKSRNFLNNLVANKQISLKRITKDRYGRTVGELFKNGLNIQKMIVKKGHGKIYKKYSHQCNWTR